MSTYYHESRYLTKVPNNSQQQQHWVFALDSMESVLRGRRYWDESSKNKFLGGKPGPERESDVVRSCWHWWGRCPGWTTACLRRHLSDLANIATEMDLMNTLPSLINQLPDIPLRLHKTDFWSGKRGFSGKNGVCSYSLPGLMLGELHPLCHLNLYSNAGSWRWKPWLGSSVGQSIILLCQGFGLDSQSGCT